MKTIRKFRVEEEAEEDGEHKLDGAEEEDEQGGAEAGNSGRGFERFESSSRARKEKEEEEKARIIISIAVTLIYAALPVLTL